MRFIAAILLALVASFSSEALAEEKSSTLDGESATPNVDDVFGHYGFSSSVQITQKTCKVVMQLNRDALLKHVEELKILGIFNPDLSQKTVNAKPNTVTLAFATQAMPMFTKLLYDKNDKIDRCEFYQHVMLVDEFGNDQDLPMASYIFTRALFKKINWDKFESQNLMKVGVNFRFNPEFQALVMREQ